MIGARTFTNKTREEDIQCVVYARMGWSVKTIARRTGLSKGAIAYRLRILNIKIRDWADARSPFSQRMLEGATAESHLIMGEIKKHMSKVLAAPKE